MMRIMAAASVLPLLPSGVLAHIRLLECLLPFLIGIEQRVSTLFLVVGHGSKLE